MSKDEELEDHGVNRTHPKHHPTSMESTPNVPSRRASNPDWTGFRQCFKFSAFLIKIYFYFFFIFKFDEALQIRKISQDSSFILIFFCFSLKPFCVIAQHTVVVYFS